jgi:hypothetical protein
MLTLTNHVKHEADEPVVPGEGDEVRVDEDDMFEIVDDRFAIKEVICDHEKVPEDKLTFREHHPPVEGFAPPIVPSVGIELRGAICTSQLKHPHNSV